MGKKKKKKSWKEVYEKYKDIPEDYKERLSYLYDKLKIKAKDLELIQTLRQEILNFKLTNKKKIKMTFYIVPEGIARPRQARGIFYVPNIHKFYECIQEYMKEHKELVDLNIISECRLYLKYYRPTPYDMNKHEKILAEEEIITNAKKPDWDNLGKGSDMFNCLWEDDALVTYAKVRKLYSCKPRIEAKIVYYANCTNSYHKKVREKRLKKIGELTDG